MEKLVGAIHELPLRVGKNQYGQFCRDKSVEAIL
jgi:hypothetical protein